MATAWTDAPLADGAVLVGDAGGWNDPIIGLGLSITYRDVRMVTDILKDEADWARADFTPYADERAERLRRLRFTAAIVSTLYHFSYHSVCPMPQYDDRLFRSCRKRNNGSDKTGIKLKFEYRCCHSLIKSIR